MRGLALGALGVGLAGGCGRADADGFRFLPGSWRVDQVLSGDATRGYGAAVAVGADGVVRVGAPWQGPGRVYAGEVVVLEGSDGDFLGSALAGGEALLVGAPGRSAVVDEAGAVVLEAEAERWLGGVVVRHEGGVAALGRGQVLGDGGFTVGERLWSLAVARLDGRRTTLLAGLASGGVAWAEGRAAAAGALGRGLVACDLDSDGDDDLALADPLSGELRLYVVDEVDALDLGAPAASHALGAGAGRSLACVRGGILVGAPEASPAGVAWIPRPLETGTANWTVSDGIPSALGFSLAVGSGRAVAGDPERGEAWVLEPRRR